MDDEVKVIIRIGLTVLGVVALVVGGGMYGCPQYGVYEREMNGKAAYGQAVQNRRIAVLEAQAALDSAKLNAQAEVARAEGTDKANRIMAQSLGGPENYLRWAYIDMLRDTANKDRSVIYLPTEAGVPVLEAGKRP